MFRLSSSSAPPLYHDPLPALAEIIFSKMTVMKLLSYLLYAATFLRENPQVSYVK
jgi:hypothetical protein